MPGVKLTYEDLVRMPDDGMRHELIDGEHFVTPPPDSSHQTVSFTLSGLFWTYLRAHPIGRVFAAPYDVELSRHTVIEPDLLYISNESAVGALLPSHLKGVPELVIEIESPSTRRYDQTTKLTAYGEAGVLEYWRIMPRTRAIEVHARTQSSVPFAAPRLLPPPDVLTTPLLPSLELPLAVLFAGTDI